ncbi:MAG TPA: NUDIX hydrolase [Longimicrobium sp.]|nr:NUDIX hydrolase [Longimicrobium sp.]
MTARPEGRMGEGQGSGRPRAWELVATEELGDYEMFRLRKLRTRSPQDGSEHEFHIADSPDGVVVIALTPEGEVVMIEQFRQPLRRVTLEMPAGMVDEGEAPEAAAARELREETGYEGDAGERLGCMELNPSWQTASVYVVLVRNAHRAGGKDLDETEDTRVCRYPLSEVRRRVREGQVNAATMLSALALYDARYGGVA